MPVRLHFFMKDTDDLDLPRLHPIIHHVMFDLKPPVAQPDRVAIDPDQWIFGDDRDLLSEPIKISIGLLGAPLCERIAPNTDQVLLG